MVQLCIDFGDPIALTQHMYVMHVFAGAMHKITQRLGRISAFHPIPRFSYLSILLKAEVT